MNFYFCSYSSTSFTWMTTLYKMGYDDDDNGDDTRKENKRNKSPQVETCCAVAICCILLYFFTLCNPLHVDQTKLNSVDRSCGGISGSHEESSYWVNFVYDSRSSYP